ncbi:MAG: hypothetical protein IKW20_02585 [Bacteroidales bacterium]|nr:hypothetical protein [Bacteroidales bacterium]
MAEYSIKEVLGKRDLKRFIVFPEKLYKGCGQYVPPLHKGQEHELMHSAPLQYCKRKMWIAENEAGEVVGRICAVINPRYNEKYGTKRVRFGWFDLINDVKVAELLFNAAERWASEEGMEEIHGPLYYNTLGRQGMLVEGFDKLAPFSCLYNYPYYVDIMQQLGFEKECDWIQYMMPADQGVDEKMKAISSRIMDRYKLHVADFDKLKKDRDMVRKFFKTYNECYDGTVYNFVPFTEAEIEEEIDMIIGQLDKRLCSVIMDSDNEVAAFGVAIPSLSTAMQKAKGRLFPFGWYHVLKAMNDFTHLDLMLEGAAPKWQNTGISAVFHGLMASQFQACGSKWALANPQIETNTAVNVWGRYTHELWLRRRCWIKRIEK